MHFKIFAALFVSVIHGEVFTVPETGRIMLHNLDTTVIVVIHVLRMNIPLGDIGTMKCLPSYHVSVLNSDIC